MKTLKIAVYEGSNPTNPPKLVKEFTVPMETPNFFWTENVGWSKTLFGFWKVSIVGRIELGVS